MDAIKINVTPSYVRLSEKLMKFDHSNKFDLLWANKFARLKSSVASNVQMNTFGGVTFILLAMVHTHQSLLLTAPLLCIVLLFCTFLFK